MFIIENGTGVARANSYIKLAFADAYHFTRNASIWASATISSKQAAIVKATDYIEKRWGIVFKGVKEFTSVSIPALGFFALTANAQNDETVVLGSTTYTFKTALTPAANEVLIGTDAAASVTNLIAAITAGIGSGTLYGAGTVANTDATAETAYTDALVATALTAGIVGNSITTTSTITDGAWSDVTLLGGDDGDPQPLSFPRSSLYDDNGDLVSGIPDKLKQAVSEYALSALGAELYITPLTDERGLRTTGIREKVGPIETETTYAENNAVSIIKAIPTADKLLQEYVTPTGCAIRA